MRPKTACIRLGNSGTGTSTRTGVTDDMLRLSIGLEDPADLIADLEQALGA